MPAADALRGECILRALAHEQLGGFANDARTGSSQGMTERNGAAVDVNILGLEAEVVGAIPAGAGGCGGRTPADDVIERSYSVLAAGALSGIDDTIVGDDGVQSESFPFLAPPTLN